MSDVLERAVEASEIVGALKPYGVTQTDVAVTVGVSDRAVRGWRESTIRPERYDRLAELRELVLLLAESLTPRGVSQWLHARSRLLEDRRPLDLIRDGEFAAVREAAEAFVDGSYV